MIGDVIDSFRNAALEFNLKSVRKSQTELCTCRPMTVKNAKMKEYTPYCLIKKRYVTHVFSEYPISLPNVRSFQ